MSGLLWYITTIPYCIYYNMVTNSLFLLVRVLVAWEGLVVHSKLTPYSNVTCATDSKWMHWKVGHATLSSFLKGSFLKMHLGMSTRYCLMSPIHSIICAELEVNPDKADRVYMSSFQKYNNHAIWVVSNINFKRKPIRQYHSNR